MQNLRESFISLVPCNIAYDLSASQKGTDLLKLKHQNFMFAFQTGVLMVKAFIEDNSTSADSPS